MTRIRWENLPSTSTPLIDTNLNKANNVVISSTEPTTGEEVWLEKGKNLLNPNALINGSIKSDGSYGYYNYVVVSDFTPVEANKPYTIKLNNITSNQFLFRIVLYTTGKVYNSVILSDSPNTQYTFTPTINGYVRICFGMNNYAVLSPSNIIGAKPQFEQSSTATSYEEFKPHKIYENRDGGYDLFTETVHVGIEEGASRVNFIKGKNLFDEKLEVGGITEAGELVDLTTRLRSKNFSPVNSSTTYTFKIEEYNTSKGYPKINVIYYDKDKKGIETSGWKDNTYSFTTPSNCQFLKFLFYFTNSSSQTLTTSDITKSMLELGSSASSYEPYVTPAIVVDGEEIYSKKIKQENYQNYINFSSGFTVNSINAYKSGNVVYISYDIAGTFNSGVTVIGTCTNAMVQDYVYGSARFTLNDNTQSPASNLAIKNGELRTYTSSAGRASAGTLILLVNN